MKIVIRQGYGNSIVSDADKMDFIAFTDSLEAVGHTIKKVVIYLEEKDVEDDDRF